MDGMKMKLAAIQFGLIMGGCMPSKMIKMEYLFGGYYGIV
jgi:hypothetical protein